MKKRHLFWLNFYAKLNNMNRLGNCLYKFAERYTQQDDIFFFQAKHADIIIKKYVYMFYTLSDEALLKVFELPNGKEILAGYLPLHQLPVPVEMKLLEQPDMRDTVKQYIDKQHMSDDAVFKLFEQPDAKELLLHYLAENRYVRLGKFAEKIINMPDNVELIVAIKKRGELSDEMQLKMFERPNAADIVRAYIKEDQNEYPRRLSNKAQLKMLALPEAEDLLAEYYYPLCPEAELMLFELPHAEIVIKKYVLEFPNIGQETEAKLFELKNAADIFDSYPAHRTLYGENELLLFTLPNGVKRMIAYMHNVRVRLEDKTLATFFEHPAAAELLAEAVKTQELSDNLQKRLFERPEAYELLKEYIEHHELCAKAQFMLFDLPKSEAKELLMAYAQKYKFAREVMQALAVKNYFT